MDEASNSSTSTGILGAIENEVHKVEDLVEGVLHPQQAATEAAALAPAADPTPNAASTAAAPAESAGTSSAQPAADDAAADTSASTDDASHAHGLSLIAKLRMYLWTFERAAVADLHAALDELETLV